MKNKKIYLILITILLVSGGLFLILRNRKPIQSEITDKQKPPLEIQNIQVPQETEEQKMTDAELQDYYSVYKNPFVIQIRTTLNSYLKDPKGMSETILEGLGDGKSGLNNFPAIIIRVGSLLWVFTISQLVENKYI